MALSEYIKQVCKIGQEASCCKYLVLGAGGFECMKADLANKKIVDDNWATTEHVAQGDNCEGQEELLTAQI